MTPAKMNAITIAVVVISLAVFLAGVLVPGLRGLDELQAEIATEQGVVVGRQAEVGDVSLVYKDLMHLSDEVRNFRTRLPNDRQFGAFLNDLTVALDSCGIGDYLMEEQQELRVDSERLPETMKLAAGTEILPVKIVFEAEFRDAFALIEKLESMPRLVYIEQVDMKSPDEGGSRLAVSMIVHAFHHSHGALGVLPEKIVPPQL